MSRFLPVGVSPALSDLLGESSFAESFSRDVFRRAEEEGINLYACSPRRSQDVSNSLELAASWVYPTDILPKEQPAERAKWNSSTNPGSQTGGCTRYCSTKRPADLARIGTGTGSLESWARTKRLLTAKYLLSGDPSVLAAQRELPGLTHGGFDRVGPPQCETPRTPRSLASRMVEFGGRSHSRVGTSECETSRTPRSLASQMVGFSGQSQQSSCNYSHSDYLHARRPITR
eukprot:TRINITY_DN107737_c0_g1_i1.p1 TRINITY_DN107737_c0_g1~~TRINITY_DN107737_c0_g1_i1.p1  ORF type:complete len:231 (-),score=13.44 TRINITY_DN107737_c0_g1_i1:189-881(-)